MRSTSVKGALIAARGQLLGIADTDRRLDAEVLLAFALGRDRAWLYAWPEYRLSVAEVRRFDELLTRRASGTPIAYLTGRREFRGLELTITDAALIPRPETETLVDIALELTCGKRQGKALDLGTGSGAIALALAHALLEWEMTATDRSAAALSVATQNAERLNLRRIRFFQGDWFKAVPRGARFHLIVSNPPYVADEDPHLGRGDVRFEPRSALCAGPEGLNDLHRIVTQAPQYLAAQAWLVLEHGADQGAAVRALLIRAGFEDVRTRQDLAGRERVSYGRCR